MKLVTFQSFEALRFLINNGYLQADKKYINLDKMGPTYLWVKEKMEEYVANLSKIDYPLWCWIKCYNSTCPPKHVGKKVEGFDVKITFEKDEKDIFITDFRRYSFLLNNMYIPKDKEDKEKFDKILKEHNISEEDLKAYVRRDKYNKYRKDKEYLEVCRKIYRSFDRCITNDSDILQGCVWRIELNEIKEIEILNDNNYIQGSVNYLRKNGNRKNWIQDFYNRLK